MVKHIFLALIFDLENVNAAIEPERIDTNVVTVVISNVLNKYLETGICKFPNKDGKTV